MGLKNNKNKQEILEGDDEEVVAQIKIRDHQAEHYKKILSILQNEPGYLDVSRCGSGKTVLCLSIAATFGMGIVLVAPKTVLNGWRTHAKKYGIHIYSAMSYSSLRGSDKNGVKHDLLVRNGSHFYTTKVFEESARSGLLLVYDECHNLKNENDQLEAAHAMSKEVVRLARMGYNCRIAALSGTPADKKENIASLLKILGVITNNRLYHYDRSSRTYRMEGLQEAVDKCNKYDPDTTFHITCRPVNKTSSKFICHELYTKILKPIVSSSMPKPQIDAELDIKNLYVKMSEEDIERMKNGALLFASATSYREETKEVSYRGMNWGMVTQSRREIDSAKVNSMVRLAKDKLDKDPNCKVILYYTYKRDMYKSEELLKKYNPVVINGSIIDEKLRTELMEKFQRNDNKYRVFISNPKVGGVGVELDDKFGGHPRFTYIAPSYMFIDQFQSIYRIYREGTKSKAVVRFIYSKDFNFETGILQSMCEKSKMARDMIHNNQQDISLPGELTDEWEE